MTSVLLPRSRSPQHSRTL